MSLAKAPLGAANSEEDNFRIVPQGSKTEFVLLKQNGKRQAQLHAGRRGLWPWNDSKEPLFFRFLRGSLKKSLPVWVACGAGAAPRCAHSEGDEDPEMMPKEPKVAFPVSCVRSLEKRRGSDSLEAFLH